ncbi:hypothetical protein MBLNU459_g5851t1 [Dothideomycetes sp. NU459]
MPAPYPDGSRSAPQPARRDMNGSTSNTNGTLNGAGPGSASHKPFAHISDLQARATQGISVDKSINHLFSIADSSLKQADTFLEYRRPDLAYVEYLRAFEIAANVIPRHSSHPSLTNRGTAYKVHQDLIKRISSQTDRFDRIKEIIVHDNKRNATQPALRPDQPSSRPTSSHAYDGLDRFGSSTSSRPSSIASQPRAAPPNGTAANGTDGVEALNERFARLRAQTPSVDTNARAGRPGSMSSVTSGNASVTSPVDRRYSRDSFDSVARIPSNTSINQQSTRLGGPRAMPNGGTSSRLPLDTQFAAAMPKPPEATYSPARNMQFSGDIKPPRTTARSIVGTGGRSSSAMSSASSYAPSADGDDADYFPRVSSNQPPAAPPRRKSVHAQREIRIGPERLYDYLKMHSILLIDVRNRDEFDEGHIYAQSVICIEPTALRKDMSAEELQDSLVLSPEAEQSMFFNRDRYDLVVYYDKSTSSDRFLSRPSTEQEWKLRFLYDALLEYNHEKPLQRPPILLMGGLDMWADLVGDQALKRSNTAARVKASRPLRRVPVAGSSSRLYVPKKRLRDYNPLDAEEERKWRERARVESIVVDQKPSIEEEDESRQVEDATPFYQNIEEFLQRFPEAGTLEQRSLMETVPQSIASRPQVPNYPSPPPPSTVPSIPSRPAPAVPRMSYSGVSDHRSISQSAQSTGSTELPAYVPPRYMPSNLRLPRTGLVNFGVTCYMNATIQALSATTPLTLFFLDDRFKTQVQRDNWKGSKGVLPELYANLIRSIWKGDVEAIRPSTLRSFCARLNSEWGIDRQQDAKEFFDFLVDCLHEDLNANWSRTPLRALTSQQEAVREKMPKALVCGTEWGRYTHREQSYLTSLFAGQHASRLRCTTCQFTSTTYEAFYSISVEIPRSGVGNIQDCLKSYCAEEMLSGDEVWKCPHCNKEREATKQITITRAPQFLVVHFKRFSAGRGESARKVRTPIDFPLRNLDLEPYMLPQPTAAESQLIAKEHGPDKLKSDPTMTPPYRYDAYAVMRHIGTTLTSGHYTCLAKDRARNCWRQFNDTWVGDFDPDRLPERDRLQNEMAYIVFYQRASDK